MAGNLLIKFPTDSNFLSVFFPSPRLSYPLIEKLRKIHAVHLGSPLSGGTNPHFPNEIS